MVLAFGGHCYGFSSSYVVLFVGFAGGYGVREYMSRRRHLAAGRIFLEKHPEFGPP
jgi:hypothetical protein